MNRYHRVTYRRLLGLFGLSVIILQVVSEPVQAMDLQTSLQYGITHYDKDYAGDCITSNGVTLSGGSNAEQIFNFLTSTPFSTNNGKPLNAAQAAAITGNLMQEGGSTPGQTSPSPMAVNPTSGALGIGQWLGGRQQALKDLATKQGLQPTDMKAQLAYLKQEFEGPEAATIIDPTFQAGTDLTAMTVVVRKKYERPGEAEANDAKRIQNANDVLSSFSKNVASSASSNSAGTTSGCSSAQANTGDLIKTALGLAWDHPVPEGKDLKADATKAYVDAIAQYGNIHSDSDGLTPYSDCGRFVSTVMRMSGLDKDYPLVGTATNQLPYVRAHPEKFIVVDNPSMSNFQPGDIFISQTHTAIYVGNNGQYDTVDASLGGRVPGVSNNLSTYLVTQTSPTLVRVK